MDELTWLGYAPSGAAAGRPCGAARRQQSACGDQPSGGARRDRTDDLMLAKHALSQLSYSPLEAVGSRQLAVVRLAIEVLTPTA